MIYLLIGFVVIAVAALAFLKLMHMLLEWCNSEGMEYNRWKRWGSYLVFGVTAIAGGLFLCAFSLYIVVFAAMCDEAADYAKRVNLNETGDTIPMYAGDTWDVDGKAAVTLKEITLLSGEDDTRYYEACFDYENISINGHKSTVEVIKDEMALSVYVDAADEELDNTVGWLSSNDEDFYYAVPGEIITDNRFRFALEPEDAAKSKYVRISFTIYTDDEYEFYRQDFVQEI